MSLATAGDNVGLLFSGLQRGDVSPGGVLTWGAVASAPEGVEVRL